MASIKKNFFYSSILTTSNYLFPVLTYPYVSRVLGVTNIGICNFVDGIINYFVLFSMMGIGTIGIREISKNKDNQAAMSKAFSGILIVNAILTALSIAALICCTFIIPSFYAYKELMFVGVFKLLFNFLLIEWFYKGVENFWYITVRSIVVKTLYVVALFVFVRKSSDYPIYFILSVLMIVLNSLSNILYSRHFIRMTLKELSLRQYVKPTMILGLYTLLTSMYTTFNVAYLGVVSNPTQVGYYSTATKLYSILMALFTAFTGVMLPRMSYYAANGQMEKFTSLLRKSQSALISFSLPVVAYTCIFAPDIISFLSGAGYEGAITPMRIVMPLMFIIGYEQILVIQTLMPLKQDKAILRNSIFGAIAGLSLNILLVGRLACIGSALVWVCSEFIVLFLSQYSAGKCINAQIPFKEILKHLCGNLPLAVILFYIYLCVNLSPFYRLVISGALLCLYTGIYQYYMKNEILLNTLRKLPKNKKGTSENKSTT